jgi:hypothetical protein
MAVIAAWRRCRSLDGGRGSAHAQAPLAGVSTLPVDRARCPPCARRVGAQPRHARGIRSIMRAGSAAVRLVEEALARQSARNEHGGDLHLARGDRTGSTPAALPSIRSSPGAGHSAASSHSTSALPLLPSFTAAGFDLPSRTWTWGSDSNGTGELFVRGKRARHDPRPVGREQRPVDRLAGERVAPRALLASITYSESSELRRDTPRRSVWSRHLPAARRGPLRRRGRPRACPRSAGSVRRADWV